MMPTSHVTPTPAASRPAIGCALLAVVTVGVWVFSVATRPGVGAAPASSETWQVDNLTRIGGHPVTVEGSPLVVGTPVGAAVEFNGRTDGLFLEVNPLAGLARFTLEVLFEPAPDGPEEQRFLHVEEHGSGNRALVELRRLADATWCLDTFLRHGTASLTLIDRRATHPPGRWHTAALSYDGHVMRHYVNGMAELEGAVSFGPLGAGRTSIGVRQNKVSWFKGRIRLVRITPEALPPESLLRQP
jgi:hypothetical protein